MQSKKRTSLKKEPLFTEGSGHAQGILLGNRRPELRVHGIQSSVTSEGNREKALEKYPRHTGWSPGPQDNKAGGILGCGADQAEAWRRVASFRSTPKSTRRTQLVLETQTKSFDNIGDDDED